jgi:hypothetical protein
MDAVRNPLRGLQAFRSRPRLPHHRADNVGQCIFTVVPDQGVYVVLRLAQSHESQYFALAEVPTVRTSKSFSSYRIGCRLEIRQIWRKNSC